jgi:ribosome modulation factor
MRIVDFAKRRPDGLIDQNWVEGFEAYIQQQSPDSCPYDEPTDQFNSWIDGWTYAAYFLNFVSPDVSP